VAFTRRRLREQLIQRGVSQLEIEQADEVLNPDVLTIGFARRFATYKRATLIFQDIERLKKIVNDADCPVQFIFAGKAHPHDNEGKEFIRQIIKHSSQADLRNSVVFLENYDMSVAHYMVQGVDVWLNNPRRPKEASGTSGMKVIYNGGLNCSILDGWWAEAYSPEVGWAIGNGEEYMEDQWEHQDYIEGQALYNILERDIVPLFYKRTRDGLPREWLTKVKASMKALAPFFTSSRMVQQYTEEFYMPNYDRVVEMTQPNLEKGLAYAAWRSNLNRIWKQVEIVNVEVGQEAVSVGSKSEITAKIRLGELTPEDVKVQLYFGDLDTRGNIQNGSGVDMEGVESNGDNIYTFRTNHTFVTTGEQGFSVRILPTHRLMNTSFQPKLITWA
jgi:starch phosphorylase